MSGTDTLKSSPEFNLPIVSDGILKTHLHDTLDTLEIEHALTESGNLAYVLWARRRAQTLAPNIKDRDVITRLLYEGLHIINKQLEANQLAAQFDLQTAVLPNPIEQL
jgi:hypothetical protein